jgi:hypothetical protein
MKVSGNDTIRAISRTVNIPSRSVQQIVIRYIPLHKNYLSYLGAYKASVLPEAHKDFSMEHPIVRVSTGH